MKFKNKQEVHEYLKNSKVYVGDKSKEVQKILHKYGFHWRNLKDKNNLALYIGDEYLGGTDDELLFYANIGIDDNDIIAHFDVNKELSVDEILSIEIEEDVSKTHIFKPFDKVLMCDYNECWGPELFRSSRFYKGTEAIRDYTYFTSISGLTAMHCIPYEGNEDLVFKPYNHEDER